MTQSAIRPANKSRLPSPGSLTGPTPSAQTLGRPPICAALWPELSALAHDELAQGGRVLAHCFGGCGRSGMVLMRLMVEAGEDADPALARLRDVRSCAVEAKAQRIWAAAPMFERLGLGQ